jgi:hypothetical protein
MGTAEDYIIGVEKPGKTDAKCSQQTAQPTFRNHGGGEQKTQAGKNQCADAQAVDQALAPDRFGRKQERCEMEQNHDPTGNPESQSSARTFAINRSKQHYEQAENENIEHFVFHKQ